MISFKQFLSEKSSDEANLYVAPRMDAQEVIDWCEKNAPKFLANVKSRKIRIYRGAELQLGVIDTNKFNRRSANTVNYYTLWLDNSAKWKEYPKRSKSLICANALHVAESFGDTHWVIPKDINLVGECSSDDFWNSFKFEEELDLPITADFGPDDIMDFTDSLFHQSKIYEPAVEKEYPSLLDALKKCDIEVLKDYEKNIKVSKWYRDIMRAILDNEHDFKNMAEVFDFLFDPTKNDFKVTTAGMLATSTIKEFWIQGQCALIPTSFASERGFKADKDMLTAFIEKYKFK